MLLETINDKVIRKIDCFFQYFVSSSNSKRYPVYKNPERDDISAIANETNVVAFISNKGDLYIFHGSLVHTDVIDQLKLLDEKEAIVLQKTFMGTAKPNYDGSLTLIYTRQKINRAKDIEKFHRHLNRWFT